QSTFNKLVAIRDLKVKRLTDWLGERERDMRNFTADKELTELEDIIHKTSFEQDDIAIINNCRRILNHSLGNYSSYRELFIINPNNGKIIVSTNQSEEGNDKSQNEYFTKPMETHKISIIDVYYSHESSSNEMAYSIPIFCYKHNRKHIVGVFVAHISLQNSLYKMLLDRVGLGKTGETLIANRNGYALNQLRWYDDAPLNLKIQAEPMDNAVNGESGIVFTKDYRGENVLAAYTYIPETKWGFVCKQDAYELNAPIREMIRNFIAIFLLTLIIIVVVALIIGRSISNPIVEMDRVAQKLKSGEFSARNTLNLRDELGSLAQAYNSLAEFIESRIKTQEGISEISETLIGQPNINRFGMELLKQLMKISEADMSAFYILNEISNQYEQFASIGVNLKLLKPFNAENPEGEFGNVLSEKSIYYLRDIPEDTIYKYKTTVGDLIPKEIITIPILVESIVVAIISLVSIKKFSNESYDILEQSWIVMNSSYSSLMSNERTRILAEQLSRTNQDLEAQTEELQEQSEEMQSQSEELQRTTDELQEQNIELDLQRKEVETANKLKSEFLSNMSHELRTPLNSIMALSNVLIQQTKSKLNEEEHNYLEIVERNGKRLLALINDILDISKIEAGKMEFFPVFISLNNLLRMIMENLQTISDEKALNLTLDIPEDLVEIETDEARLYQVLTNIIGNAVKFTEKGSVDISVKQQSKKIIIEVKDTGIGISKDVLPHIFEEFRQADGSSTRTYEGTGLGLAIAKRIIQILKGDIQVKSKIGVGTTFTISIPVKWEGDVQIDKSNIEQLTIEREENTIAFTRNNTYENYFSKILIVEDNEDSIIQLKTVLENEGFSIDIANNGQNAIDYLQDNIPDGIILDLMMPGIDGFEVLEKIRNIEVLINTPIMILTAKDLSIKELTKLKSNNIYQIIQKGDIDYDSFIHKLKLMIGIGLESEPITRNLKPETLALSALPAGRQEVEVSNLKPETTLANVLIIEDNPDNMISIKAILKEKYNITEAYDGEQGLKMAQSQLPDIILLDISIPEIDGEIVIKKLKENKETKNIKVIAVTAQAMIGDKEKILKLGCDGYVSKPIDQKKLIEEIDGLLNG
ncbi:response regulator, partial [Bacteroidota bacterium]